MRQRRTDEQESQLIANKDNDNVEIHPFHFIRRTGSTSKLVSLAEQEMCVVAYV